MLRGRAVDYWWRDHGFESSQHLELLTENATYLQIFTLKLFCFFYNDCRLVYCSWKCKGGTMSPPILLAKWMGYQCCSWLWCMFCTGNTKGGSITVPLTSGLTGLESAVWQLTKFVLFPKQTNPNQSNRR